MDVDEGDRSIMIPTGGGDLNQSVISHQKLGSTTSERMSVGSYSAVPKEGIGARVHVKD